MIADFNPPRAGSMGLRCPKCGNKVAVLLLTVWGHCCRDCRDRLRNPTPKPTGGRK